jgi:flavin reductase (DIM6/NTAB) family NADH-FMN oxidoreductase RutF
MSEHPVSQDDFDARALRNALGDFATGVAVVSCLGPDGMPFASTVSSFNSVSLDPPLVLFSLARNALSLPAWEAARHYTVSVLHGGQEETSNSFARAATDKWQGVDVRPGEVTGVPMIADALAGFECESYAVHDGGDHLIFIGKVLALHRRAGTDRDPLVFFGGRYRKLASLGQEHS